MGRLGSTTSLPPQCLGVTLPRSRELSACSPTQLLLLKLGRDWTISLILCMLREHLFIGMSERVWKKENLVKLVRTLLHSKKITRKLEWIPLKERKETSTNCVKTILSSQYIVNCALST